MNAAQLFPILRTFIRDLSDVTITNSEELKEGGEFMHIVLTYNTGMEIPLAVIHYENTGWVFTPRDWQGRMPETLEEVAGLDWRVNNTDMQGANLNGLPRLSPFAAHPDELRADTRKELGDAIRAKRQEMGLTLRQLATLTGYSHQSILSVEDGDANVTIDKLVGICYVLKIRLATKEG